MHTRVSSATLGASRNDSQLKPINFGPRIHKPAVKVKVEVLTTYKQYKTTLLRPVTACLNAKYNAP